MCVWLRILADQLLRLHCSHLQCRASACTAQDGVSSALHDGRARRCLQGPEATYQPIGRAMLCCVVTHKKCLAPTCSHPGET